MKTNHTSGPWRVEVYSDHGGTDKPQYQVKTKDELIVAKCGQGDFEIPDNARLIAAAPELLEALQRLDDYYTRPVTVDLSETDEWAQFHRDVLTPARAALVKAKGAS